MNELEPITFQISDIGEPILLLKENGDIYVNGKLTTNDMEIAEDLRRFLQQAQYITPNTKEQQ